MYQPKVIGLPAHLQVVPPAPEQWNQADANDLRLAFRRWRYEVLIERTQRHLDLKADPGIQPFELMKCSQSPAYFAAMWLRVFEPRWRVDSSVSIPASDDDDPDMDMEGVKKIITIPNVPQIVSTNLRQANVSDPNYDPALAPIFGWAPFICYADQVRVMDEILWTLTQTDEHADIIWSKSRGWGASWILCLLALWGWMFSDKWATDAPWNVLLLSRKEEYVDSKQQKSLFWKIRRLMRDIPEWMMPKGWLPDYHDQKGVIINPENGNEIGGESTNSNAGRGDRVTWAAIDEAAAVPDLLGKWSTLTDTTDHRIACSTESYSEGTAFFDLQQPSEEGFVPFLIETNWWENPLNDDVWLERQRKRFIHDPEMFQQEIWRRARSGSSFVYPWAHTIIPDASYKPVSGYISWIGIDPGYRDPTALVAVQEYANGEFVVLDAYQANEKESDFFMPLLKPELFGEKSLWYDKSYVEWVSPLDSTLVYEYKERELAFARTVHDMGTCKFIGDTYGESMIGASKDSVYSRWRKAGINVNRDRKTGDAVTKNVKQLRSWLGRKNAMNELSRKWRFANTDGARMCLKAWQNSKFKAVPDRAQQSEPTEPEHGPESHLRTAGEFIAAQIQHRGMVVNRKPAPPQKATMRTHRLSKTNELKKVA